MINYFNRRFQRLLQHHELPENTQTITEVQCLIGLNATHTAPGSYSISLTKYDVFCMLNIHYIHNTGFDLNAYNIIALPPDINSYIAEYLPSDITLSIQIDYFPTIHFRHRFGDWFIATTGWPVIWRKLKNIIVIWWRLKCYKV